MLAIQRETYASQIAYDYFRTELDHVLDYVFNHRTELEPVGQRATDQKVMLRNMIIALAHKIYLDKLFALMREDLQA